MWDTGLDLHGLWRRPLNEAVFLIRNKLLGGRVPVEEALERDYVPWRNKLLGGRVPVGEALERGCVSVEGTSCLVAESQWERHLSEAVFLKMNKLLRGRVPVEEALERGCVPWNKLLGG
ncbi:Plakin repeat superfamily [Abeliophyllum distichum]|uniref:Plakin repeat superfamily n=1 Tax=Abeliophyllum distichum TaxID=126358 RepID=A0ABD1S113_9LAMI